MLTKPLRDGHPLAGGRPSLDRGVSPLISFRAPRDVKQRLASIAVNSGRTQADVAREAFEKGLALVGKT